MVVRVLGPGDEENVLRPAMKDDDPEAVVHMTRVVA